MPVKITYRGDTILREVIGKRRTLKSVMAKEYTPTPKLLAIIGQELVNGFQGGRRLLLGDVKFGPKGGITFTGRNGQYHRGIMRRVSPNGKPYPILVNGKFHAQSTLDIKERNHSRYAADQYVLRDTGELMDKFTYAVHPASVSVGYFGRPDLNDKSVRLEKGGNIRTGNVSSGKRMRTSYLTPRPHRDVQPEVTMVIMGLLKRWAEKYKGKKI